METRRLGTSDLMLTVVGLGAWAMGGTGWAYAWGPQDDDDSIAAIHRALDLGVNWIDTAAVYGLGHAEEVVGRALAGRRDEVMVATKCGLPWNDKGRISPKISAASVRAECEASLKRLGTDVIDLYQIHWPTRIENDLEGWETMARLRDEGKIRHAGVSNFDVEGLEALSRIMKPASLQPPYSMIERGVEDRLLPYCAMHGIGVICYSPLQCGLLTGKMTRERIAELPKDDHRVYDKNFKEPKLTENLKQAEALMAKADALGVTPAQLAIAWTLRRPEVTAAIVGARRPEQIEETAKIVTDTIF